MSNLPTVMSDNAFALIEKRANILAKSTIMPMSLRNKPSDIAVILMIAAELDIPPMQAINGINVIQGRPTISPQLMLALIRRNHPDAYIKIEEGDLIVTCAMARSKSKEEMAQLYTSRWDMPRAQKMGLTSKDNYSKQPQTMLKWRAVGEAARVVFPDVLSGLYFPNEMTDEETLVDEHGEATGQVVQEDTRVTKEDLKVLAEYMRTRGFTANQLKNICKEKFNIERSESLTKEQYKELLTIMNNTGPDEIKE